MKAQYSHLYYHCQGDTVIYDAESYYHSWWAFEESLETQDIYHIRAAALPANKLLLYHFTDTPLQVVGLAIMPFPILPPAWSNDPYILYDTSVLREYLYLCEAGSGTTYELARVRWLPNDTSRFIKIRHTEPVDQTQELSFYNYCVQRPDPYSFHYCCGGVPFTRVTNVAEYYFEHPITVCDSFYVGCSNETFDTASSYDPGSTLRCPSHYYLMAMHTEPFDCKGNVNNGSYYDPVCNIQWPAIFENHWDDFGVYGNANNPDSSSGDVFQILFNHGTFYTTTPYIPMVFPIVMVDTTVPPHSYCPAVENLQLTSYSPGCIDLSWDAFVNHRNGYEIFYGRRNQQESEWTTVFVQNNFAQLCDLDPRFFYEVRVIPVCDKDQNSAQWVVSAPFRPDGSSAVSVTEPSALSRHTTLSPNPTTGIVHIHSDYVITRLDIYDTEGRHLDFYAYPGRDADLDLSNYAPGLYHLVVSTPQGRTTKQVIKE